MRGAPSRREPVAYSTRRSTAQRLVAPMPGKLHSVHVGVGDLVRAGQVLMVLEAMKMEHAISAPREGVVERVCYAEDAQVAEGAELLVFEDTVR